jgi:DNA-binding transcriptional MerR regulator
LRAASAEIIQAAVADDWDAALSRAFAYLEAIQSELAKANRVALLLQQWAQKIEPFHEEAGMASGVVSKMLGVSYDVIRNWERNGLVKIPRNPHNNYRLFGRKEIDRLQIIRMLSRAGYSHMAILRMFIEFDGGKTTDLINVLDTPRADEDIFTAADHWLTTLQDQERLASQVIQLIEKQIAGKAI